MGFRLLNGRSVILLRVSCRSATASRFQLGKLMDINSHSGEFMVFEAVKTNGRVCRQLSRSASVWKSTR